MPRIHRPNKPPLPKPPGPHAVPPSPRQAQTPVAQQADAREATVHPARTKAVASPQARAPGRAQAKPSGATRTGALASIEQASPDAESAPHLSDEQASALFAQWCHASLADAMGQLRDWHLGPGGIGHAMLARLASDASCQAKLESWLAAPKLVAAQRRPYVQALETLIDKIGPQMPAAMVMAQLSVTNAYLAPYSEHHVLLELLQNQLRKGVAAKPEENIKALICAALHLPCGHIQPGPGWVQGHVWLDAVQKLSRTEATDACFLDILTRVLPCDLFAAAEQRAWVGATGDNGFAKVMLLWPGAEHLFPKSTLAWQRSVVAAGEHADLYPNASHLVGPLHLLRPDPFDIVTHHLNHLRRAADGGLLSPWWTSVHAARAVKQLAAMSENAGQAIWKQVVHKLLHAPYQHLEPLRAFAAEMLKQKHLQLSGALIVDLLAFDPMAYRFERYGEYYKGFWLKPEYVLEAAKVDPQFVLNFVARHQSDILDPRLGFLDPMPGGGTVIDKLGQLAMVYAPEDMPRLRAGALRAKGLREIWQHLNDGDEDDATGVFEPSFQALCDQDPDAQQVLGSRGLLAEAASLVIHASPSLQVAMDRLFLWHSVVSGVGIGDDYAVFENLADERDCILDPLHPIYEFERNPHFTWPKGLVQALGRHVDLNPVSRLDSPQLAETITVRRRQVLGRLTIMAAVAHCSSQTLEKRQDLILALVTHPRAYEWPIASLALVLHCLRDGVHGDAAADLIMRLQKQSVPIDLVVSLQIMGAFGQNFLGRASVQYTVAALLRKDSGAERAILQGLVDYGLTLFDATVPEFSSQAASSPIFHILRGAGSSVTAQMLIEQWTSALESSPQATAKQEANRIRRAKIAESMLREHDAALTATLPHLADWERVDADSALREIALAFKEQGVTPATVAKRRSGAPALLSGLFAAKTNVRAVQQFYGERLLPTTLALLRHYPSLIQLRDKDPHELVRMLNGFVTPAQVFGAIPRLLELDAWGRLDAACSSRPETLALSIKYAHGLEKIAPDWAQGFKQALQHVAQGVWQQERLRHTAFVGAIAALPASPKNWSALWTQGFEMSVAPHALQGTDRPCRLMDTDSFLLTFYSGTDVTGSCQNINGAAALNCGLLSRMQMASKRLVAIVDDRERIFARAVFYVARRPDQGYGLFMGPVYGATQADREETTRLLFDFARLRARTLGLPLFTADKLHSDPATNLTTIEIEAAGLPDYIDGEGMITEPCMLPVFETDVLQGSLNASAVRPA